MRTLTLPLIALSLALAAGPAMADPAGITVSASGTASEKPTIVEIRGQVSVAADKTSEALTQFKAARSKILLALEKLEMENLSIDGLGLKVAKEADPNAMQAMMGGGGGGGGAAAEKKAPKIDVSETLRLRLTGIDKLKAADLKAGIAKILDAAREAGLTLGARQSSMMEMIRMQQGMGKKAGALNFSIGDLNAVRSKAYKLAFADARRRAEELAKLAGLTLGGVRSITEGDLSSGDKESGGNAMMAMIYGSSSKDPAVGTSAKYGPIDVKVELRVVFDIKR